MDTCSIFTVSFPVQGAPGVVGPPGREGNIGQPGPMGAPGSRGASGDLGPPVSYMNIQLLSDSILPLDLFYIMCLLGCGGRTRTPRTSRGPRTSHCLRE